MCNDILASTTPPPFTLRDCIVDGELNLYRYRAYRQRVQRNMLYNSRFRSFRSKMTSQSNNYHQKHDTKRKYRSIKKHRLFVREDNEELREYTMKDTLWYRLYCVEEVLDTRMDFPPKSVPNFSSIF